MAPEKGGDNLEGRGQGPKSRPGWVITVSENADMAFDGLNREVARHKAEGQDGRGKVERMGECTVEMSVYMKSWSDGTVDSRQVDRYLRARLEMAHTKEIEYFGVMRSRAKANNGDLIKVKEGTERDVRSQREIARYELYYGLTHEVVKPGDKTGERKVNSLLGHPFVKSMGSLNREEMNRGFGEFMRVNKNRIKVAAPEAKNLLVSDFKWGQEMQVAFKLTNDKNALAAFNKAVVVDGKNANQALEDAMQASPDFKREYYEYVAIWEQDQFKEVFGEKPIPVEVPGVATPDQAQLTDAKRAIADSGVRVDFGDSNEGKISLGNLSKDAAIVNVDGQTKLVIYDENADRGFIGPIEPAKAKETMRGIAIDAYFTEQFQKASTLDSVNDPSKMKDAKLFEVVRMFLPKGGEGQTDALTASERGLVGNLVRLLVKPDEEFVSIQDKARFLLEYVAIDPSSDRFLKAKRRLNEKSEDLSLSDL